MGLMSICDSLPIVRRCCFFIDLRIGMGIVAVICIISFGYITYKNLSEDGGCNHGSSILGVTRKTSFRFFTYWCIGASLLIVLMSISLIVGTFFVTSILPVVSVAFILGGSLCFLLIVIYYVCGSLGFFIEGCQFNDPIEVSLFFMAVIFWIYYLMIVKSYASEQDDDEDDDD